MTEAEATAAPSPEAAELESTLFGMEVNKRLVASGFDTFSEDAKNEVVLRLLRERPAPLPGRVLARLAYIETAQNRPTIVALYRRDVGAGLADARRESLYGLGRLGGSDAVDAARAALRDGDDGVVVAAVSILLPRARQEPALWRELQRLYQDRKDDPHLYNSMGLLKDSGIEGPAPR